MLELIRVNLYVILIVVFVVVALGVANTLLMAVLERTHEFGLHLALGTRPGQIVRTVLYESLVLGVLGLVAGVVAGSLIGGSSERAWIPCSNCASCVWVTRAPQWLQFSIDIRREA